MKRTFLLFLAICFFAGQATATDKKGRFLILGPGAYSCSAIIADIEEGKKRNNQGAVVIYSNWLAGNLTAYNRDTKDLYSVLGESQFSELFEWTLNYCEKHPNQIYSSAVDALIKEFWDDRYTSMPEQN